MQSNMRKVRSVAAIAAACALPVLTSAADAQTPCGKHRYEKQHPPELSVKIGATGGASFPLGRSQNGVDPGWTAGALIDITHPELPVGIRLDGGYQKLVPSEATDDGSVNIWGGDLNFLLTITGRIPIKPYVTAGVGLYRVKNNITGATTIPAGPNTDFGWNGGAGLRSDLGGIGVFLETHYLQILTAGHDLRVMPVTFGFMLGSGGRR